MGDTYEMMNAYLAGELNAEQVAELEAWLREDPERARHFVRQAMLDCHLDELLHEQNLEEVTFESEQDAEELPPIHIDANALTRQKYVAALSYVLRHTFTPKRIAMLATAAAVLLGAVLAIVMLTGPDESEPIAEAPDATTSPIDTLSVNPIVATLTAEHDAVWSADSAEGASAPGSQLRAGDRHTLTAGFAEITTNDGAVAILEAPATIEFLDNDNAIHLHAGKLVGICETDSSKGFLVRTPHMDITDLGTRFGVEVQNDGDSYAHVFEGVIEVTPIGQRPVILTKQQGLAIEDSGSKRYSIRAEPLAFVADIHLPILSGPIVYRDQPPGDLGLGQAASDSALIFLEQQRIKTSSKIKALVESGNYEGDGLIQSEASIDAGVTADSYLVHFDPVDKGASSTATFTIRMPAPILAVLTSREMLEQSEGWITHPRTQYPRVEKGDALGGFGLEGKRENVATDIITISEDRRTVTATLSAPNTIDQFRILVEAGSHAGLGDQHAP